MSATGSQNFAPGVDAALPGDSVCRLSVEQYHRMFSAGILHEDSPVELLDGWLVPKMIKNPPHVVATELVRRGLEALLGDGWHLRSREPITLADSEPEPDVAVVRGGLRDYVQHHPTAFEVALVVEVADATRERDQSIKRRLYARAGIAGYWIVNLIDRCVDVFGEPTGPAGSPD